MTTDTPYRITIDRERSFAHIDLIGFWTMTTAQEFVADYGRLLRDTAFLPGGLLVLLDQHRFEVQSVDVAKVLGALAVTSEFAPRKVAIVSNKALLRMQGKRMKATTTHAWFDIEAEALDWLFTPSPEA